MEVALRIGDVMNEEEYRSKLKGAHREYKNKVEKIKKQYCEENLKYKVGDIICDHYQTGVVVSKFTTAKLGADDMYCPPEIVYSCVLTLRNGKKRKQPYLVNIYESNIKKKLGNRELEGNEI